MKTMQKLGLTAMAVAFGALIAAPPAFAGKPRSAYYYTYTFTLVPPQTDSPEPKASGRGAVEYDVVGGPYTGVSVSCSHLTPGQQYHLMIYVGGTDVTGWPINPFVTGTTCTTDKHGNFDATITLYSTVEYCGIYDVWIENDAGEVVLERQFKK